MESCCNGLEFMHNNKIYHGDLKSKNIVINDDGEVKISDAFVHENYFSLDLHTKLQRWNSFLPPETIENNSVYDGVNHDLWALGMIFVEAATLLGSSSVYTTNGLDWKALGLRLDNVKNKYSQRFLTLLHILLDRNPERRRHIHKAIKERDFPEEVFIQTKIYPEQQLKSHHRKIQLINEKLSQIPLDEIKKNLQESRSKGQVSFRNEKRPEPGPPSTQASNETAPGPCRDLLGESKKKIQLEINTNVSGEISEKPLEIVKRPPNQKTEALSSIMMENKNESVEKAVRVSELFGKDTQSFPIHSQTYRENKFKPELEKFECSGPQSETKDITRMIEKSLERSRSARKLPRLERQNSA